MPPDGGICSAVPKADGEKGVAKAMTFSTVAGGSRRSCIPLGEPTALSA